MRGKGVIENVVCCGAAKPICQQVKHWLIACNETWILAFEKDDFKKFAIKEETGGDIAGRNKTEDVRKVSCCLKRGLLRKESLDRCSDIFGN